jgi:flagellar motor switch protein FliN/FliY
VSAEDLASLLQQPTLGKDARAKSPDQLLSQAEADLAAALHPDLGSAALSGAAPYAFQPFDESGAARAPGIGIDGLDDVELDLRIELGRAELLIDEVLELRQGSVVPLDKLAGDPVDILVNGRLIARGEVLVLNDNFCVRVAEILTPDF